jgi:hypothetical protein
MPFGRFSCWMAFLVVLNLGCGSDPDSRTPVSGKVFFKGAPLKRGTIVFSPDERRGGRGELARAEIQPDGSFSLKTGDREGAVAGWHRVTIVAVEVMVDPGGELDFTEHRSLVPLKYRDPELSGLDYQVEPGKENHIDFHLD